MRLSHMFWAGARKDVRLDVRQERVGKQLLFPYIFCVLLGITRQFI